MRSDQCTLHASRRISGFFSLAGTAEPREAVTRIATMVRQKSGQENPPFDTRAYCAQYNVLVQQEHLNDCVARLIPVDGGYIAQVNAKDSVARQRFSICHELAHVFFQLESQSSTEWEEARTIDPAHRFEEQLCNKIAAELLMPASLFRSKAMSREATIDSVRDLASIFEVSFSAALVRIVDLDAWECCAVTFTEIENALSAVSRKFSRSWRSSSAGRSRSAQSLASIILAAGPGVRSAKVSAPHRTVNVEWRAFGSTAASRRIYVLLTRAEKPALEDSGGPLD
jgi:Zn-dependent peptidase ImmA (M78 family)